MSGAPTQFAFEQRIALERIDRDIFSGWCHSGAPQRAYGGQIAAQALMAAGQTVDDPQRRVHSLHGYFLRPGGTKESITYLVERLRDGRSFSTRFVRAVQNGETIFMMTASFAVDDPGPMHQFAQPDHPTPESIADLDIPLPEELRSSDDTVTTRIGLKIVEPDRRIALRDGRYERLAWVRIEDELPSDTLTQACALTYLSDLTMVSTALGPHVPLGQRHDLRVASVDHAVWFHQPTRADTWLLFAQDTPVARHGHGLARGLFFDDLGQLVASVVQESLMRNARG